MVKKSLFCFIFFINIYLQHKLYIFNKETLEVLHLVLFHFVIINEILKFYYEFSIKEKDVALF